MKKLNTAVNTVRKKTYSQNNVCFFSYSSQNERKQNISVSIFLWIEWISGFLTWNNSMVYQNAVSGIVNFIFSLLGLQSCNSFNQKGFRQAFT